MAFTLSGDYTYDPSQLNVGITQTGTATVDDGSILTLDVPDSDSILVDIGVQADGNGTITVSGSGSVLALEASDEAPGLSQVNVGDLGTGALVIEDDGTVRITNTEFADFQVGETQFEGTGGGLGSLNLSDGNIYESGWHSELRIGRNGGTGTALFENGSSVTLTTDADNDQGATMQVGAGNGGHGSLTVDASSVDLGSHGFGTLLLVGTNSGTGSLVMQNGSTFSLTGGNGSVQIGNAAGAQGTIEVKSGAELQIVDITPNVSNDGGYLAVGTAAGVTKAVLTVDGQDSRVDVQDGEVYIGSYHYQNAPVGKGTISLLHGGELSAHNVYAAQGGTLEAASASLNATYLGIEGGTLHLLSGGGELHQTGGGLTLKAGGVIQFDVAADGQTVGHYETDSVLSLAGGQIAVTPLGGYKFAAGATLTLAHADAAIGVPDFSASDVSVSGQASGFGFSLASTGTDLIFKALNAGTGTGTAILDFGSNSDNSAHFTYATGDGSGTGDGGLLGYFVVAKNVDELRGTGVADTFSVTGSGSMSLLGRGGMDTLLGGAGDDKLDGGDGADTMKGGAGKDTYLVDSSGDVADETGGAGGDTIRSSISFSLADMAHAKGSIENLTLAGSAAKGSGNSLANLLTGNSAENKLAGAGENDVLKGGDGGDKLTGGTGADDLYGGNDNDRDVFVFAKGDSGTTTKKADQIFDFHDGSSKHDDRIDLSDLNVKWSDIDLNEKGSNVKVEIDYKGSHKADMMIEVMKVAHLHHSDFIL